MDQGRSRLHHRGQAEQLNQVFAKSYRHRKILSNAGTCKLVKTSKEKMVSLEFDEEGDVDGVR